MERASVVALALFGTLLASLLVLGFVVWWLSNDPAAAVRHSCASAQMGPGCRNLKVTSQSASRIEFTYDLADGSHCTGFQQLSSRGLFGSPRSGGGGAACAGPGGRPPGVRPLPPTPFPDGSLPCPEGRLALAAPVQTATGFEIKATNISATTCAVVGPAKLAFMDAASRTIEIPNQFAGEPATPVVLAPGAAAIFAFDTGQSRCQAVSSLIVFVSGASYRLQVSRSVCGPVVSHSATAAP